MTIRTLGLICARGGSKGLPGKNIRTFLGEPLITRAVRHALAVPAIDRVLVSTDSLEIAELAQSSGAWLPFIRPPELARDESPEWQVWQHALRYVEASQGSLPETLVVVPATAPLREPYDVADCIERLNQGDCDVVITVTKSQRSPYFNMVQRSQDGLVSIATKIDRPIFRRQDAPVLYDITPVAYSALPQFVLSSSSMFDGRVASIEVPATRAVDIDTPMDFAFAELLASKRDIK